MAIWKLWGAAGCLALMAATHSYAQSPPVPKAAADHVRDLAAMCADAGGKVGPTSTLAESGDFNGDGLADWAISDAGFNCEGAASLFGGTAGTPFSVFAGLPGGDARLAFSGAVYDIAVERSGLRPVIWLTLGGAACGQGGQVVHGSQWSCDRALVWNPAKQVFAFAPLSQARNLQH